MTQWQEVPVENQFDLCTGCAQDSFRDSGQAVLILTDAVSMVKSRATLVQEMKKVLEELPGVGCYMDDKVFCSDSWEEYLRTLKELFGRLGANRMEFLGLCDNPELRQPAEVTPRPTHNKKQVKSFLVGEWLERKNYLSKQHP